MYKILRVLFFLLISISAAAQNTFEKVIDTLGSSGANCIQQTFDGGYVLCGQSYFGGNDALITKLDSLGNIEWLKIYSGPGAENAMFIEQTPDSGYLLNALYDGGLYSKNWILRLDVNGDTLWTNTLSIGVGATNAVYGNSMASINNIRYGVTGYYKPFPLTNLSAYFIGFNSNGVQLANKIYNTSNFGTDSRCIATTKDSGYIMAGVIGTSNSSSDVYLIRTNINGDTLWTRAINHSQTEAAQAIQQTSDSGFIVAGYSVNNSTFQTNTFLIKTNLNGDTLWTKLYGGSLSSVAYSVQETMDSGFIICGVIAAGIYLLKTDMNGDSLWSRIFSVSVSCSGYFVRQTKDNGFIISGVSQFPPAGTYIIKTDSLGRILTGTGIVEINNLFEFNIYPNPSSGFLTIQVKNIPEINSEIEILNMNNKCIYSCRISNNSNEIIDLGHIPNGVYIVLLRSGQKIFTKKILIQK